MSVFLGRAVEREKERMRGNLFRFLALTSSPQMFLGWEEGVRLPCTHGSGSLETIRSNVGLESALKAHRLQLRLKKRAKRRFLVTRVWTGEHIKVLSESSSVFIRAPTS